MAASIIRGLAIGLTVAAFFSCGEGRIQEESPICGDDVCELGESAATCPADCVASLLCGNGGLDPGESCDGDCPVDCDDKDACTIDTLTGSAAQCDATCIHEARTKCASGDGCCPTGCTVAADADCSEEPPAKLEIGNTNYWDSNPTSRQDSRLAWDAWGGITAKRPGTTVVYEQWVPRNQRTTTNLPWVKERFDLATQHKDKYDYATYLLIDEIFSPHIDAKYGKSLLMTTWSAAGAAPEGKATFAGITVKLLKTWFVEDKKLVWDAERQDWWDNARLHNIYNDPIIVEWSNYYAYSLFRAWHQHMRNLGKRSALCGLGWLCGTNYNCFVKDMEGKFSKESIQYLTTYYDALFTYMYPRSELEIQNSVDMVKTLRETYNYKGKLVHILTSSFILSWVWNWDKAIAWAEFKAVAPYVDVILAFYWAQDSNSQPGGQIEYPPILIKFWEDYLKQSSP